MYIAKLALAAVAVAILAARTYHFLPFLHGKASTKRLRAKPR
ncbi:MAG TPA: hypothetical protein VK596_11740 [Edaphobacter sp.]|nr:hypothetical protein [Edaphobacter sp.]